jgi:hypothetical protein
MAGLICSLIIGPVTIDAFNAQRVETQEGGRFMANGTIAPVVRAEKRKPASLVDLGNIIYNPGSGIMAP